MAGFAPEVLAKMVGLNAPKGLGTTFFVDGVLGLDTNPGTPPEAPMQTIAGALGRCINAHNDYIYVFSNPTPEAVWPIVINKTFVHIIGIGHNPDHRPSIIIPAGDTAVFLVSSNSNKCEIAGFRFGGGATHAGIENVAGTPMGLYIHDCLFGHQFDATNTPLHGIWIGANATALRIEKCKFFGTNSGRITGNGINFVGAGDSLSGAIVDCLFKELPGIGINGSNMIGFEILDNRFGYPVDNAGAAITLAANCHHNVVMRNNANVGKAVAGGVLAYVDGAVDNHWSGNLKAGLLNLPA